MRRPDSYLRPERKALAERRTSSENEQFEFFTSFASPKFRRRKTNCVRPGRLEFTPNLYVIYIPGMRNKSSLLWRKAPSKRKKKIYIQYETIVQAVNIVDYQVRKIFLHLGDSQKYQTRRCTN